MYESEQTAELATALAKAQGAMKSAVLNKINPHFKSRYADLAAVLDAIRKPLSDHGLSITQVVLFTPDVTHAVLRTTLRHMSGQWVCSEYPLPWPAKPQELGSALTYARRYSISAITCIAADEDDDGNAASNGKATPMPVLDDDQLTEVLEQLTAAKANVDDFLVWIRLASPNVRTVSDIPASLFETVMEKLQDIASKKRQKAPKGETGEKADAQ